MENLISRKLTWANENPRRANLPRRPFQTHISTISVHDAEFSAKKGGPVASRRTKRQYHERHFTIGERSRQKLHTSHNAYRGKRSLWDIGKKVCPGLFAGMGPRIARVELAPHHRVAPSRHGLIPCAELGGLLVQAVYVVVGRHVPQDALGRRRALEPARAVPEHGFDHMVQPHAPVLVEHDPYLPVHPALYGVVGGGDLAVLGEVSSR